MHNSKATHVQPKHSIQFFRQQFFSRVGFVYFQILFAHCQQWRGKDHFSLADMSRGKDAVASLRDRRGVKAEFVRGEAYAVLVEPGEGVFGAARCLTTWVVLLIIILLVAILIVPVIIFVLLGMIIILSILVRNKTSG